MSRARRIAVRLRPRGSAYLARPERTGGGMRKVFISSTSDDLEPYRKAARDAVIRAGCHPVMMEYFTAQGKRKPYPACMREVDTCDIVIAIVAHRYGWVPADQPGGGDKSITWLECERGKEVIACVVDEKHPWPLE